MKKRKPLPTNENLKKYAVEIRKVYLLHLITDKTIVGGAMETAFPQCWRIGNSPPSDKVGLYVMFLARLMVCFCIQLLEDGPPL